MLNPQRCHDFGRCSSSPSTLPSACRLTHGLSVRSMASPQFVSFIATSVDAPRKGSCCVAKKTTTSRRFFARRMDGPPRNEQHREDVEEHLVGSPGEVLDSWKGYGTRSSARIPPRPRYLEASTHCLIVIWVSGTKSSTPSKLWYSSVIDCASFTWRRQLTGQNLTVRHMRRSGFLFEILIHSLASHNLFIYMADAQSMATAGKRMRVTYLQIVVSETHSIDLEPLEIDAV